MKKHLALSLLVVMCLAPALLPGCGRKQEQAPAQQAQQQAQEAQQAQGQAAQGAGAQEGQSANPMEQMQKATEQLSKAFGGGDKKPVPPVPYKTLMEFMPKSYKEMKTDGPEGESATFGEWSYSQAKIDFNAEEGGHAEVQIVDYAHIAALYAPYQFLWSMKISKESSHGYERAIQVGKYPAFEKWDSDNKRMELSTLVGERFVVIVNTNGLPEGAAKELISGIDVDKLAGTTAG